MTDPWEGYYTGEDPAAEAQRRAAAELAADESDAHTEQAMREAHKRVGIEYPHKD